MGAGVTQNPSYDAAMNGWIIAIALVAGAACSSKDDTKISDGDFKAMEDEASVDWARSQLSALDAQLASSDPGSASSTCAVIKPDMRKIKKADPELAETLARKCGRDLAVRSLTVAVERAEKDRSACRSISIYEKSITKAGAEADPEVAKLRARVAAACAAK
jgi:hypothetical protein